VLDQTPLGLPSPAVTTTFVDGPSPHVHAVVDMTTPIAGELPRKVGKTIIAGWRQDRTPIRRFRVQVTGIDILNPLKPAEPVVSERKRCSDTPAQDCSVTPCPPGQSCLTLGGDIEGWEVFLEANGDWRKLAGLEGVLAPVTIQQTITYDVGLPPGEPLRLHASGHSLDCRESIYAIPLRRDLAYFGFTDGVNCLLAESHDVGDFDLALTESDLPPRRGTQTYVTPSVGGAGGACSVTTSQLCLTDVDCPSGEMCVVIGGSFKLHYTITRRR
jgi:hypothetical protein